MDFKEKINYIHEHPEIYLSKDKSGRGWICPICGSGSGRNGTGMTESKVVKGCFTCWAGSCFGKLGKDGRNHGDIIDMIQEKDNLTKAEAINKAFRIYDL